MSFKIYTYPNNPRVYKVLIAAEYNEIDIEVPDFEFGKDNKTPQFLAKFPAGKVPAMDTPHGPIYESNAMLRYVAKLRQDSDLAGATYYQSGLVEQWLDFANNELSSPTGVLVYPFIIDRKYPKEATDAAWADVRKVLKIFDDHLLNHQYFVGNSVTIADIGISCTLFWLYKFVMGPSIREEFYNVTRWFDCCINQPQFKKVIGSFKFLDKDASAPAKAAAPAPEEKAPAKEAKGAKKQAKADKKPKKEEAEEEEGGDAAPASQENLDLMDQLESAAPKKKNPLDDLPKSSMSLDTFKRTFYLTKFEDSWPKVMAMFDHEGYSAWVSEYQYNNENTVLFMTSNLVAGFIQRLDNLRKYGFGALTILGEDKGPFDILGGWFLRGQELPFEMKDCYDSEYYNWRKLDLTNPDDVEELRLIFGGFDIGGKTCQDIKYFK